MGERGDGNWLKRLAAGEVPLPEAFWAYAVVYGLFVNFFATMAAFAAMAAGGPAWLVMVLYALPLPYNLLVALGVWRAAGRWQGDPKWAGLARLAVVAWTLALIAL